MISPLTLSPPQIILCCYVNSTAHVEVAKITNIPHWSLERVLFPGQQLLFNAPALAKLEIHTGMSISAIISETIDCQDLQLPASFCAHAVESPKTI